MNELWAWMSPPAAWQIRAAAECGLVGHHNPATQGLLTMCLACEQCRVYVVGTPPLEAVTI